MESEAVDDIAGPLLKPLGVDGAPFSDVGEWLLPFSIDLLVAGVHEALRLVAWLTAGGGGGMVGGVDLGWVFTSAGESGIVPTFCTLLLGEGRGQAEIIVAVIINIR